MPAPNVLHPRGWGFVDGLTCFVSTWPIHLGRGGKKHHKGKKWTIREVKGLTQDHSTNQCQVFLEETNCLVPKLKTWKPTVASMRGSRGQISIHWLIQQFLCENAHQASNRINTNKPSPRHIVGLQSIKDKQKHLRGYQGKNTGLLKRMEGW